MTNIPLYLAQNFSGLSNRHYVSKDGVHVRITGRDVEQALSSDLSSQAPINIIAPGTSLTLDAFIKALKLQANSSSIGKAVVSRFQLRKSKRLPFRHEYVLFFIESGGVDYIIRVDRLGNLGSLTKGVRWHLGSFGIGGCSKDCVRIEEVDSDAGQLLRCDAAGSTILADLHHWSSILKNKENYTSLWKAAANLLKDISYGMKSSERYLLQQFMDAYDTSSDPCFGLTAFNRARFRAFEQLIIRKLPDSIPDLLVQYLRVYSCQKLQFHDPTIRGIFAPLGLNKSGRVLNQRDRLFHYRALTAISHHPLTLLDLSHRLEVLSKAWPAYNLVTTNCELFSRSLYHSNLSSNFCFVSNGYLRVPITPGHLHIAPPLDLTAYHTFYIVTLALNSVLFVVLPFVLCFASTYHWVCVDHPVQTPEGCIDPGIEPHYVPMDERRLVLVLIIWVAVVGNLAIMFLSALKLAGTRFLKSALQHEAQFITGFPSFSLPTRLRPQPKRSQSARRAVDGDHTLSRTTSIPRLLNKPHV